MLNIGLNGILGLAYWVVAARSYSVEVIGRDTALIAAMQTLSTFAQLDMASVLLKFLPTWRDNAARALRLAYIIAASLSVGLALGFAEVAPRLSPHWAFLGPVTVAAPLCCGVALWSVFALEDGALTGLRRATLIPIENSSYGLAKLLLLATVATLLPNSGVFYSWVLPLIPVALVVNWFLFRRALPAHRALPLGDDVVVLDRRQMVRYVGFDYVGSLCGTGITLGMPLIVSGVVGVREAAVFYFPWTLILLVDAVGYSLGASLIVEGTTNPGQLVRHARSILRLTTLLLVPAVAVVVVFAPLLLDLFGTDYARQGTTTVRILILASLPRAIVSLYTSVARVQAKLGQILLRVGGATVLIVTLVIVLGRGHGIEGVAVGWLIGSVLEFGVIVRPLWQVLGPHRAAYAGSSEVIDDGDLTVPLAAARLRRPGRNLGRPAVYAVLALVGLASGAALVAPSPLRAVLGLLVVLVVPGAAVTSRLRLRSILSELLLAVVISASLTVVGGYAMLELRSWLPLLWMVLVGTASGAALAAQSVHLAQLQKAEDAAPVTGIRTGAHARSRRPPTTWARVAGWGWSAGAVPALCIAAVALWALSLPSINPESATDAGLIGQLPVTFFLALASLTAALGVALYRNRPGPLELAVVIGLLVTILYATTPLIASLPRYTYLYKHLGVASYFALHGAVQPPLDIYQNWPGFFALLAVLERFGGISGLSLATWGQVAFALIDALAVRYVVRGLTSDARVVGLATWLYLLFDWVGQNYLSPQAFGFAVTLTALGLVLHHLPPDRARARPRGLPRWLAGAAITTPRPGPEGASVPRWVGIGLVVLVGAAVTVSHQLSPLMLLAFVAVVVVTQRLQLWWLLLALTVLVVAQYARAWPYLSANGLLLSGLTNIAANSAGTSGSLPASSGHLLVEHTARVLSIGVWLGAAIAVAVRRRRGYVELTGAALVIVPFALLGLQRYGGEAIYRVFLFTSPWCAYLIASALMAGPRSAARDGGGTAPPAFPAGLRSRQVGAVVTLTAMLVPLWLTSFYGLYRSDYVRPSELAGWSWFASHAPAGSVLDYVEGNFPSNATGNYDLFESNYGVGGIDVVSQPGFKGRVLRASDVPAVIALLRAHSLTGGVFVALSAGQEAYAEAFGLSPPGNVARFETILAHSPSFRTVFHEGSTTLLELRAAPGP